MPRSSEETAMKIWWRLSGNAAKRQYGGKIKSGKEMQMQLVGKSVSKSLDKTMRITQIIMSENSQACGAWVVEVLLAVSRSHSSSARLRRIATDEL